MKFKIDEHLPDELAADLRAAGHDTDTVHDEGLTGSPDSAVMARALSEGGAVLTMDKGIAGVRAYPPAQHVGLILLRPRTTRRLPMLAFVRRYLPTLLASPLAGHLYVVTETGIRVLSELTAAAGQHAKGVSPHWGAKPIRFGGIGSRGLSPCLPSVAPPGLQRRTDHGGPARSIEDRPSGLPTTGLHFARFGYAGLLSSFGGLSFRACSASSMAFSS